MNTATDFDTDHFGGSATSESPVDRDERERVVDLGSGAGFDSFLAANAVGPDGYVVGIGMTPAILNKSHTIEEYRVSGSGQVSDG